MKSMQVIHMMICMTCFAAWISTRYATSISEFTQDAAEYHTCYDAFLQSLLTQRDDVVLKLQTLLHVIFKLCYADRKGVENHCIAMAMEIFHELCGMVGLPRMIGQNMSNLFPACGSAARLMPLQYMLFRIFHH